MSKIENPYLSMDLQELTEESLARAECARFWAERSESLTWPAALWVWVMLLCCALAMFFPVALFAVLGAAIVGLPRVVHWIMATKECREMNRELAQRYEAIDILMLEHKRAARERACNDWKRPA